MEEHAKSTVLRCHWDLWKFLCGKFFKGAQINGGDGTNGKITGIIIEVSKGQR